MSHQWQFYPSKINDAPASVRLNLWFGERAPVKGFDHLLWVFIEMDAPGDHGMGLEEEAATTGPLEDALAAHIETTLKTHYVARIRGEGSWQLYFYGATPGGFEQAVDSFMKEYPNRKYQTGHKPDPSWSVFRTVIFPDDERQQWIADHSVVEALRKEGDPLTETRRVDHWIYFKDPASRDRFERAASAAGFATQERSTEPSDTDQLGIQIFRDDHVDLERIHAVVMELVQLAAAHGGDYDGWETQLLGASR